MKFVIDSDSGTPLYLQIKNQIMCAIAFGDLQPGDPLPSIRQLEAELGINRNTIRTAYLELQHEGLVVVRQGKNVEVAPRSAQPRQHLLVAHARKLAQKVVQEVETQGIDSLSFASLLEQAALAHDRMCPKHAFIECSQDQADDLANAVEGAWNRRVIGIALPSLQEDPDLLQPSIKCVLTTPWHIAEVRTLLHDRLSVIHDVRVRLSQQFHEGVQRLAGLRVGLILRDPESIAGYRELVRKHARPKGQVSVALMEEREKAIKLLNTAEGVVHTAPCRRFVVEHAPPALIRQEFLYEPVPEDLECLKGELFTESLI